MLTILLYIWQLPQILVAFLVIHITKAKKEDKLYRNKKIYLFKKSYISGISLGEYIILNERDSNNKLTLDHEYGHTIQSRIFGPLYLVVIGIPSAIFNNLWDRIFHKKWKNKERTIWYYSRYPEKWADDLGGVKRFQGL
jgi:hypothetical protein